MQPPAHLKTVSGEVQSVVLLEHPPSFARHYDVPTAARRAGVLYEKKVVELLFELLCPADRPGEVRMYPGRWFKYADKRSVHYCQPDLVVEFPARRSLAIFEIKAVHTENAWWQLVHLYKPIVEKYWPGFEIQMVEVTKSFDPSVPWPGDEKPEVHFGYASILDAMKSSGERSEPVIVQWRPRQSRDERHELLQQS